MFTTVAEAIAAEPIWKAGDMTVWEIHTALPGFIVQVGDDDAVQYVSYGQMQRLIAAVARPTGEVRS